MSQEVRIVARTFEVDDPQDIASTNDDLTLLAGKAAGVCYMPDNYFEDGIQNVEKALARAEQTAKSGHHSVYDHGHITMVVKTNKMMAMILNSLGVYTTSEKSARYTKMQPETELELQLYNKWRVKIRELILEKYPDTDDSMLNTRLCKKLGFSNIKIVKDNKIVITQENVSYIGTMYKETDMNGMLDELKESDTLPSAKLAQENARYMISVFTPTTMMYTVSFRQMFLTINYLYNLSVNLDNASDEFSKKLKPYVIELWKKFEEVIGDIRLYDNKNQYIRLLEAQHLGEIKKDSDGINRFNKYENLDLRFKAKKEIIGDSYTIVYKGSLAMLAQAQRHRTLRYSMFLQEPEVNGFYTPEIVKQAGIEEEWQKDINSVAYCIPQGTLVRITEQGIFEDFALKCKERLCGRAQLEIMNSTAESVKKFIDNINNLCYDNQELLKSMTLDKDERAIKGLTPCARCMFKDFKCSEGCQWGPKDAFNRLV